MKKLYVVLLIAMLTPIAVYAWNDCPYGLLNDAFPGQCPRYVDTNHDNICDHSESPPSSSRNISSSTNNNSLNTNSNANTTNNKVNTGNESNGSSEIKNVSSVPNENYYMVPLGTTITIIYLVTYLLYLEKRLKRKIYYRIWNTILILSFLITGVTGLIMVIFINYAIQSSWNLTIDFWHAEFAIIMAFSTIFHFHLYWKQLKKVFKF